MFVVAAEALEVRFAEEEGGFGKGAQFQGEVGVWDVEFGGGEGGPVFGCWRRTEGG